MNLPQGVPGVGLDLVEVERFRAVLARGGERIRARLFTPAEREDCGRRRDPIIHLAARFAAKEAAMKALGTGWSGGIAWRDFEVVPLEGGAPTLSLSGKAAELAKRHGLRGMRVSLTHTKVTAGAVVVAET